MAASAARIAEVLAGLRGSSARLRTGAELERPRLVLQWPALDRVLGGGLLRGKLTELCGPRGSGRMAVALAALRSAHARGELAALVDVADALDPRSAERAGVSLDRLLWVRPPTLRAGLQAVDRVLDAGGFAVVVLYVCGAADHARPQDATWVRLAQRAERSKSTLLIAADRPLVGTFGAAQLHTRRLRAHFSGQGAGRLLDQLDGAAQLTRNKLGEPGAEAALTLQAVSP